jgi:TonB-dependent SusC/RagA subfamily outer membrane receptor
MLGAVAALAVWLGAAGPLMAQVGGTVRGTVTDAATLRGLANARVILVSEGFVQEETRTNADGVYVMRGVPAGQYSLQFTLIGYSRMEQPVTVTVGQETVLDVAATQAAIQLDALVVTGTAGRTERREIGNAVTSIDVTDLTEVSPIANIQELLNARSPGLTMYKRSGLTGTSSNVQIRGAGSLNASYAPVYYIDGIRFDGNPRPPLNDNLSNATVQFRSPLEFIDPADIERIEVIKGPAASTLYGADAAGGVIQIITKKGTRGADRVQWSASFELTQSEWVKETPTTYKECTPSRQTSSSYPGCVDPSSVVWEGPDGPVTGIPEQDILRDDAWGGSFVLTDNPLQRHPRALREANGYDVKLSARGGGQLFNYYMSFNRMDEEGVFFNNFQDRTGGRANFEWTPTGTLSLGLNMGYTRYHAALPLSDNASSGLLRNAYRGEARARVRDDSDETPGFRGASPDKSNSYDYQMREERTTLGLTANFNPWPWFENRFVVGLDKYDVRETVDGRLQRIDPVPPVPRAHVALLGRHAAELPTVPTLYDDGDWPRGQQHQPRRFSLDHRG